jgi:endo-1,3(4)-beta-glucanase
MTLVSATGTQFLVTDTSGTTYVIYALSTISLSAEALSTTSGTIRAQTPFTGVLRLAQLEQASHRELLDAHFEVYPTAASIDYVLTDDLGTLIFNWETVGSGDSLLMLTWPHHRMTMQDGNFPDESSLGYLTTKVSTTTHGHRNSALTACN